MVRTSRSMLPREHGAWAQLALPLTTALAMALPGRAGFAFACSSCALFLTHEPVLVVLGLRGSRARREEGTRARRWLATLGGIALLSGGIGLATGSVMARASLLLPSGLSVAVGGLVLARKERTLGGELVASAALASLALPVAVADGVPPQLAGGALAIWVLAFGTSTYVVRGIKDGAPGGRLLLAPIGAVAILTIGARLRLLPWPTVIAIGPVCGVLAIAVLAGANAKHLRKVGWSIAGASTSTAALLVLVLKQ